jgi:hypothetical protein
MLPALDCRLRHGEVTGSAPQDSALIIDKFNGCHFRRQYKKEQPFVQKGTFRLQPALTRIGSRLNPDGLLTAERATTDSRARESGDDPACPESCQSLPGLLLYRASGA